MNKYRLKQRDYCWYPEVKTFWGWRNLTDRGEMLPRGTAWSGPLELAVKGIQEYERDATRKADFDILRHRLNAPRTERTEVSGA